jgi:alpha-tubulin suppressor-like RCC1 family protein
VARLLQSGGDAMHRCLAAFALLPACTTEPEPPTPVPWTVHAMSVSDIRTLIVAGVGGSVEAGSVQTLGTEVPRPASGDGTALPLELPLATGVASGRRHACVISTMQVVCWGDHEGGALGAHRACLPPVAEGGASRCVLEPALMPSLPAIRAIAAGDDVTCTTAIDDRVYCWGDPADGALAGSHVPALDPPEPVRLAGGAPLFAARVVVRGRTACAIDHAGTAWCWGAGFGDRPRPLELTGVVDVAIGRHHACAIADGGLTCWGENRNGQVGDVVHARGCGEGRCVLGPTRVPVDAVSVVIGERHTCALTRAGQVACWGSNERGQLGRTDAFLVGDIGVALESAIDLQAGYARTCALGMGGVAWCWGEHVHTSF